MTYACFGAFTFLLALLFSGLTDPEFIAHRGASHDAPENTLAAVNLAWKQKADAVEVDVHLSKDGKIVAIHDDSTKKTGGRDRKVKEQTLAELRELDVGSFKGEAFKGEPIPTLEEVFKTVPEDKALFVEIKCGPEIADLLADLIRRTGMQPKQVVIISFDIRVVEAAKKKLPRHKVYWLSDIERDKKTHRWKPSVEELIAKAKKAGVDGLNVYACAAVDAAFVQKVKEAGLGGLYVWTVNDPKEAKRLIEAGVAGITTDRPAWLKEQVTGDR
jgi:glycerophosphoryl diester phosphodiesterase